MFIPQGKPVHENLSTRYLLVDALIEDLREQSFAGLVEAKLPDEEYRVMMDDGKVVAVLDSKFAKTNVKKLVSHCRAERGGVSFYAYPQGLALKFAARMVAEPLYVNLSADFADLEKLIVKLMRETDRRWFIEVTTGKEKALIFIDDGNCALITATGELRSVGGQTTAELRNSELRELIEKCHAQGGSFDVLFQRADEEMNPDLLTDESEPLEEANEALSQTDAMAEPQHAGEKRAEQMAVEAESSVSEEMPLETIDDVAPPEEIIDWEQHHEVEPLEVFQEELPETLPEQPLHADTPTAGSGDSVIEMSTATASSASDKEMLREQPTAAQSLRTHDLMAALGNNREALEGLKMAEVKRLMGKILKTVGDAVRVVEQRDNFNLHLRAGQLKVADRFPFLDPFGAEFEYFDGEIAFVGHCESDTFIEGLTEAVKMAITESAQASAKPVQLRTIINEELHRLLQSNREELELYHLDAAINDIIGRQMSKPRAAE